jgi:hypothetical protein
LRRRLFLCRLVALGSGVLITVSGSATAPLQWTWQYTGSGIFASGTLTTNDVANAAGYFQIIAITGSRNGVAIVRLQPTGTAIPGNEPYAVDNLISQNGQHLTDNGIGFALADGTFANPFFAHTRAPPTYLEFLSTPRSVPGSASATHSELPVTFTAALTKPAGSPAANSGHAR